MKRILFPTDFSECSDNALEYALALAEAHSASLTVFHALHPKVEISSKDGSIKEADSEARKFENMKEDLKGRNPNILKLEFIQKEGFAVDTILEAAKSGDFDWVVMGTEGEDGIGNWLLGSISNEIIQFAEIPVFSIPAEANYAKIKKIAFAADLKDEEFEIIDQLYEITKAFDAHLDIVHVNDDRDTDLDAFKNYKSRLAERYDWGKIAYHTVNAENVEQGLEDFINEKDTNLLAMLTHKRNFFQRLFGTSTTQEMAFHSQTPLVAFHS